MNIRDLRAAPHWISTIARSQFELWGPLTGAESFDAYVQFLASATTSKTLPRVLVAEANNNLLGSVNVVVCDCPLRSSFTPWLAQLFVAPHERKNGVGAALVQATQALASELGFSTLYLYTSGTLPEYYRSLGWSECEKFAYLGKERTLMSYDLRSIATRP